MNKILKKANNTGEKYEKLFRTVDIILNHLLKNHQLNHLTYLRKLRNNLNINCSYYDSKIQKNIPNC